VRFVWVFLTDVFRRTYLVSIVYSFLLDDLVLLIGRVSYSVLCLYEVLGEIHFCYWPRR
jgi:hypothetical protein